MLHDKNVTEESQQGERNGVDECRGIRGGTACSTLQTRKLHVTKREKTFGILHARAPPSCYNDNPYSQRGACTLKEVPLLRRGVDTLLLPLPRYQIEMSLANDGRQPSVR